MTTNYIGADVDCRTTELAVRRGKKIVSQWAVPTRIPALVEALRSIRGRKIMVIEECDMADWLYRNLRGHVDRFVVCDPRRNRLITRDGDKTNPMDAKKLSELLAGNHVREVYHSDSEDRVLFKQWISLYHDRVHTGVGEINKIRARCRMHGVWPARGAIRNPLVRDPWLKELDKQALAGQLRILFVGFDATVQQVVRCRQEVGRRSKAYEVISRWQDIPGVGPIRAATFFAYMDTPWRFSQRKKRWRYCGVGLVRKATGTDRRGRAKPGKLRVDLAANRRLKDAVIGAAISAIGQGDNVLADHYRRLCENGLSQSNARRAAERKFIDTLTAMWKTGERFQAFLA